MRKLTSLQVLLVDDEEGVRKALQMVLSDAGFAVTSAANGEEGVALFRKKPWDLIITDGTMPGMNGRKMAALMKEINPDVPIILISAIPDRYQDPALFECALLKPFSKSELLRVIELALTAHSNREERRS